MIDLSTKPTIPGRLVILRPFEAGDLADMEECLNDEEVNILTGSTKTFDRETIRAWYSTRNEKTDRLDLAIVDKSTHRVVGEVVINEYDESRHSMNFRILIGPHGRNRGLGSEATSLIIDYVFSKTDLRQLTLGVYSFNPRAMRVYEKAGFVLESVEEAVLEFEGCKIDSLNMVLTREQWEKRRRTAE